jgi:hypothetical protein
VAYDFFYRKWVPKNIALSSIDVSTSDTTAPTDLEKSYLAKLAVMKMNAEAGDKKSQKAWRGAMGDLRKLVVLAKKGDPKSKHMLQVVRESGLFSGVKAMSVSGAETVLSRNGNKLVVLLGKVKDKAVSGDMRAIRLVSAINRLHLESVPLPPASLSGDEELVEELKTRAEAGDVRSQKRLEALTKGHSKTSGEDLTEQQIARKMLEDAAEAKSISRASLKKAILLYAGQNASDKEKASVGSKVLTFLSKKQVEITS